MAISNRNTLSQNDEITSCAQYIPPVYSCKHESKIYNSELQNYTTDLVTKYNSFLGRLMVKGRTIFI